MTDQEIRAAAAEIAKGMRPLSPEELRDLDVIFNCVVEVEDAA